jgi:hypothetical protein
MLYTDINHPSLQLALYNTTGQNIASHLLENLD